MKPKNGVWIPTHEDCERETQLFQSKGGVIKKIKPQEVAERLDGLVGGRSIDRKGNYVRPPRGGFHEFDPNPTEE